MLVQNALGVMLIMADQIGVQSGARIGIHSHLNISQGGILNEYSRYGAYRRAYNTGALARSVTNNAVKTQDTDSGFLLMKEILINTAQAGAVVFKWDMNSVDNATMCHTFVGVNGVILGAFVDRNVVGYLTTSRNYALGLAVGDRIQIWGCTDDDTGGHAVGIRNFQILWDWRIEHFGDGTSRVLTTALPLADVDLIDVTNTLV